jgi:general secretion pathway protein G
MKRAGFTMIELIFVIVILGILAAVAIPKLAATRDDAKVSGIVGNARTLVGDVTAFYTSQGEAGFTAASVEDVTNVPATVACGTTAVGESMYAAGGSAGTRLSLCDGSTAASVKCITFDANATHLVIQNGAASTVCTQVQDDPAIESLVAAPIQLGGVGVVR